MNVPVTFPFYFYVPALFEIVYFTSLMLHNFEKMSHSGLIKEVF